MPITAERHAEQALSHTITQAVRRAAAKPAQDARQAAQNGLSARETVRLMSERIAATNARRVGRADAAVNVLFAVLLGVAAALVSVHYMAGGF